MPAPEQYRGSAPSTWSRDDRAVSRRDGGAHHVRDHVLHGTESSGMPWSRRPVCSCSQGSQRRRFRPQIALPHCLISQWRSMFRALDRC